MDANKSLKQVDRNVNSFKTKNGTQKFIIENKLFQSKYFFNYIIASSVNFQQTRKCQ